MPEAPSPGFITEYRFHLGAASIASDDRRFTWDANFGGDVDLLDYGRGRFTFLANYQVILGEQRRAFDPNQGNYTLELSASARLGRQELAAVFHHVSRHLGDRTKSFAVDWNTLGARLMRVDRIGRLRVGTHARLSGVLQRSFVDYDWEAGGGVLLAHQSAGRWRLIAAAHATVVGVDTSIAGRDTLTGAYGEGGVQIIGESGALDLFIAIERRIDANALDRLTRSWALLGFRLTSVAGSRQ